MDFVRVQVRYGKKDAPPEIYPAFVVKSSKDLMIRGGDFYAVWDERKGLWSLEQDDAIDLIDSAMEEYREASDNPVVKHAKIAYLWNSDTGSIDKWHKYVQRQLADSYHPLNEKLIFQNTPVCREDYASIKLSYSLEPGDYSAWNELVGTLYAPEERHKIEWAIGSIVAGDSKDIQKFCVFYGSSGTGKSTILNIIEKLFEGYTTTFMAKDIGNPNQSFALEPFKSNPLVAIQQDGDLSKIEDNSRLNSLVSHDKILVNEKFKSQYEMKFHAMLFLGTNKPVRITDTRSGIIRRLIDIRPTEHLIPKKRYDKLISKIDYELGAIAYHCYEVYSDDPNRYNDYIPKDMIGATNDFFNFVEEYYDEFYEKNHTTLNEAWLKYKAYCDEARVSYPYSKRLFKEELKGYFDIFKDRYHPKDGEWYYNWYSGFRTEKFGVNRSNDQEHNQSGDMAENRNWLQFGTTVSLFDIQMADCPAQLANPDTEAPMQKWDDVNTILNDIKTTELHYVRVPENHVVIDFDIKDEDGNKSYEKNLLAASKWPSTYAELSKSGKGIHLHYIYTGDVSKLSRVYDDDIEVKIFTGKSALRRKLTRCNDIPISTISSGLPLKGDANLVKESVIKDEKHLRSLINKALRKEIEPYATKTSIDFIDKILSDCFINGMTYDVSDMKASILAFAGASSHNAIYCLDKASAMQYKSEAPSVAVDAEEAELIFFDVEVFPNLFVVVIKPDQKEPVAMINPTSDDISRLCRYRLVGFNNRKYDNHILWARMMGKSEYELFIISQNIINGGKNNSVRNEYMYREAYNLSYTDVYDFCDKKQSLKKWEIELGIHHQELGLPWDQPVPEELWPTVADYCKNDVIATEAVFYANSAAFSARKILVELANALVGPGSCENDTTNMLTTKLIVGNERNPQSQFIYPDLSKEFPGYEFNKFGIPKERYLSPDVIVSGKSIYKGYDPGEGGFVFARHGMYDKADCFDSASHHPSSLIAENGFGPFTENFKRLLDIRLHIKHKEYDEVRSMFGGILSKYLQSDKDAKALSQALKIAINSVYGLTAAHFDTKLRDPRNEDNWVAKRGALFMIDLMLQVEKMGYTVIHVKTDSIKIAEADDKVYQFVYDYGKKFGYTFEIEHRFEKLCLVDDANYICKYTDDPENGNMAGKWDATGDKFSHPVVFKTLFSHEPIEFRDRCETFTVAVGSGLYLDWNEELPDVTLYEKEKDKLISKWKKRKYELCDVNDADLVSKEPKLIFPRNESHDEYHRDYIRLCELNDLIKAGHDYHFVGKAGSFCPMKPGTGGGLLVREKDGKYSYAGGSKGYRWMEAEMVKALGKEDDIDTQYYAALIDKAVATINEYGDFDIFAEK